MMLRESPRCPGEDASQPSGFVRNISKYSGGWCFFSSLTTTSPLHVACGSTKHLNLEHPAHPPGVILSLM
ncbi:polymerase [Histoplasma capsulatum var. duboisii H88]|uniref:Polymerase n=1 Tax=Ajellomyces capsulatus (strain H88) TaxID=544711 RepID=A0A8A1L427_AJEC8|nr:polymerase [Histoplasma capsulatum var. duboisii H88]